MDIWHATASFSNGVLCISLLKLECLSSFSNPSLFQISLFDMQFHAMFVHNCAFLESFSFFQNGRQQGNWLFCLCRSLFVWVESVMARQVSWYNHYFNTLSLFQKACRIDASIYSYRFRFDEFVLYPDGSLGSQAISAWIIKPISLLEECAFILDYVHILTESKYHIGCMIH